MRRSDIVSGLMANLQALRQLRRAFAIFLLALCFVAPALGQAGPEKPLWPHLASDIEPDPAVKFGVLGNGMRYALMRNQLPPGAVAMRFSLEAGSLHEADDERGLAHFVEHMAFNGSTNVPEGEMVKILERLGLAFGADTNATTGQKFTTYMLDLPNASDGLVEESLFLLREIASELAFGPAALDRERGVVLAEWRRGDNFSRRRSDQLLNFLMPGAYAASRMPIGDPEVIETVSAERLAGFYNRYYRPERAVLVVVGDVDVEAMESRIRSRFGDWSGRGEPGLDPEHSYTPEERPSAASVFTHKDGGDSISVYSLRPYQNLPDTAANRRDNNLLGIAIAAVGRRLAPMASAENPPFRSAGLIASDILETVDHAGGSVTVTPQSWRRGLQALEQEWRRALEYGFTREEIDEQLTALRASQVNAAQRERTRSTGALVSGLLSSIQNGSVFSTPSAGLARFESWAGETTPETVLDIFRKRMTVENPLFFMASSVERPGVEQEIVDAWKASRDIAVTPPVARLAMEFAYTDFGEPGEVVKDERLADIDARLVTFDNNVRLNLKKTAFQNNSVQVSLRVGEGAIALEDAPFGLAALMSAYAAGGLEQHSADDLRSILSGKAVQGGFTAMPDAFGGVYTTTPSDLELQLMLSAAYLIHPGYRPEAERRWREAIILSWPRFNADAQSVFASQGARLLTSGDKRFGADPNDGIVDRSFAELKAYLDPILKDAAIEIAIVGDIDEQAAIDAVAKTFGALPKRKPAPAKFRSGRPVVFRQDRTPIRLTHNGEADQALAKLYWHVDFDPEEEPQQARILSILGSVTRLKVLDRVREDLGASYAPSVGFSYSSVYPGLNYVFAGVEARPQDMEKVESALRAIANDLRNGRISQDEFDRALAPSLEQLPSHSASNGYWLSVIAEAQTRPDRMNRMKLEAVEASLRSVTIGDLVEAANRWLRDEDAQLVIVAPLRPGEPKPPSDN